MGDGSGSGRSDDGLYIDLDIGTSSVQAVMAAPGSRTPADDAWGSHRPIDATGPPKHPEDAKRYRAIDQTFARTGPLLETGHVRQAPAGPRSPA